MNLLAGREVPGSFLALQVLLRSLALPGLIVTPTNVFSMPHSGIQAFHLFLPFPLITVTTYLFCVPDSLISESSNKLLMGQGHEQTEPLSSPVFLWRLL